MSANGARPTGEAAYREGRGAFVPSVERVEQHGGHLDAERVAGLGEPMQREQAMLPVEDPQHFARQHVTVDLW